MRIVKNIILALVFLAGLILISFEIFCPYWFNLIFFVVVIPGIIGLSDLGRTLKPEYYDGEGTPRFDD